MFSTYIYYSYILTICRCSCCPYLLVFHVYTVYIIWNNNEYVYIYEVQRSNKLTYTSIWWRVGPKSGHCMTQDTHICIYLYLYRLYCELLWLKPYISIIVHYHHWLVCLFAHVTPSISHWKIEWWTSWPFLLSSTLKYEWKLKYTEWWSRKCRWMRNELSLFHTLRVRVEDKHRGSLATGILWVSTKK